MPEQVELPATINEEVPRMDVGIGQSAGVVWNYLDRNENVTVAGLVRGTGLKQKQVERALGWLSREGKVTIGKSANKEVVSLLREGVSA